MIEKGYVSAILEGGKKVTVVPAFSADVVSHELVVPFFLYKSLEVKMPIVYCYFPDNTGLVLARMDGEWNHKIWQGESYAVEVMTGDVCVQEGDLTLTLGNFKAPAGDLQTAAVPSQNTHTHTCPEGGTTSTPS